MREAGEQRVSLSAHLVFGDTSLHSLLFSSLSRALCGQLLLALPVVAEVHQGEEPASVSSKDSEAEERGGRRTEERYGWQTGKFPRGASDEIQSSAIETENRKRGDA